MVAAVTNQVVVYRARNLVNGKRYVGVTKVGLGQRESGHRKLARAGKGYRLHAALRKYGDANFVFETIFDFADDIELAFIYEAELIEAERPEYNACQGGWLGSEALEKLQAGKLHGRTRRKMTEAEKAHRRKLFEKYTPNRRGKLHTDVSKAKMSASHKGSLGPWLGKKRPSMRMPTRRAVICLDDGKIFASIRQAEIFYDLRRDGVGEVVRGRNATVGGMRFAYAVKE